MKNSFALVKFQVLSSYIWLVNSVLLASVNIRHYKYSPLGNSVLEVYWHFNCVSHVSDLSFICSTKLHEMHVVVASVVNLKVPESPVRWSCLRRIIWVVLAEMGRPAHCECRHSLTGILDCKWMKGTERHVYIFIILFIWVWMQRDQLLQVSTALISSPQDKLYPEQWAKINNP